MEIRSLLIALLILSVNVKGQWVEQYINTTSPLTGLQFLDNNTGWVMVQNQTNNAFYKTTDAGNTWTNLISVYAPLLSKRFLSSGMGWINYLNDPIGSNIIKTTDGGQSWSAPTYMGQYYFWDMIFFDDLNGIACGGQNVGPNPQTGAIFTTSDGGQEWSVVYSRGSMFFCFDFLDQNIGLAAGTMHFPENTVVMRTTDGGDSWQNYPSGNLSQVYKIQYISDLVVWVKQNIWLGELYNTTDGGITWNLKAVPIRDFWFKDQNSGWYCNEDKIYFTTDAGDSWSIQYSNPGKSIKNLFFVDSLSGWACGDDGLLLHTINGGTPVELISFTAETNNLDIVLNWVTASEVNNKGFEVERKSINGVWENIAFVQGKGTTTERTSYSFRDYSVVPENCSYRLKQIDFDGSFEYSETVEVVLNIPMEYSLEQNYPNPFNPATTISYSVPVNSNVTIKVYNALGQQIASLVNEEKPADRYEVVWNADNLPSGMYIYEMRTSSFVETRKMILMK